MDNCGERGSGDGEERINQQGAIGQTVAANVDWKANENVLQDLISLGIDRNTAIKSLYYTSNDSVEKAMDFIFQHPNPLDLSKTPLEGELEINQIYKLCNKLSLNDQQEDDYKMVFVLNTSLNMSLGKCCSQVAHSALAIQNDITKEQYLYGYQKWLLNGEKKIVLAAISTDELERLKEKASNLGLPNIIIQDAGLTEIKSGSKTVLAIFGKCNQIDKVTGNLKLLK